MSDLVVLLVYNNLCRFAGVECHHHETWCVQESFVAVVCIFMQLCIPFQNRCKGLNSSKAALKI